MTIPTPPLAGNAEAIFLDTETTTDKATPERDLEVIELAWLTYGLSADIGFARLYKPKLRCTFGAMAVHHILPYDLEGCPPSAQATEDTPRTAYWIGHNIDFDWRALGSPAGPRRICTLAMARYIWPDLESHTLSALAYYVLGATAQTRERLRSAHSALADVRLCQDLFEILVKTAELRGLAEIYKFSEQARVPTKWGFGKFAGQPIEAADRGYAGWCARQPDFDPYYIVALKQKGLLR